MHLNSSSASSGAHGCAPYVGMGRFRVVSLIALSLLLSACGLKGALYLPENSTPVVITPAADSASSSSSSESSSAATTP